MADLSSTIYIELREMARRRLAAQRAGHTLQPTALVNEVWLKLRGHFDMSRPSPEFFKTAAEAMRQILIDHARSRMRLKRGGGARRDQGDVFDLAEPPRAADSAEILSLNDALSRLEQLGPDIAEVVKLKFFCGLTVEETAAALGMSERTVKRDWQFARAWLAKELSTAT